MFDGEGGLAAVAQSYKKFGLHITKTGQIQYREWAPSAKSLSLFGDFNDWNREEFYAEKDQFGVFTLNIPACEDGSPRLTEG